VKLTMEGSVDQPEPREIQRDRENVDNEVTIAKSEKREKRLRYNISETMNCIDKYGTQIRGR
jgi:hypothetical protein